MSYLALGGIGPKGESRIYFVSELQFSSVVFLFSVFNCPWSKLGRKTEIENRRIDVDFGFILLG